jgi:Sulfotransferase family
MQPKVAIARLPGTARYRVVGRLAWYGAAGLFAHVADRGVAPLGSPSADRYLLRHGHNIWMWDHQGDRGEFCRSCLRRAGRSIGRLDEHEMRRRESRRLGRPVVGDDPGLRVALTDLADARLTPIGRVWLRNELIRRDVTEAGLHDELRHRPDVIDTLVPRPLVVVGLPRTGTTLLHALLGCDPAAFVLPFWQQLPAAVPGPAGQAGPGDPDRASAGHGKPGPVDGTTAAGHPSGLVPAPRGGCVATPRHRHAGRPGRGTRLPALAAGDPTTQYRTYRRHLQALLRDRPGRGRC